VFGAKAAIQRYCRHKERNILEHLPQDERPLVQRRLRTAWATADPDQAAAELEQLARGLARQRPGAAASLREGLAETLTVTRLGVGGQNCYRRWSRPTRTRRAANASNQTTPKAP